MSPVGRPLMLLFWAPVKYFVRRRGAAGALHLLKLLWDPLGRPSVQLLNSERAPLVQNLVKIYRLDLPIFVKIIIKKEQWCRLP